MAVKCVAEVTIVDETDIDALVTWFKWSSSATLPSAPTTTQTSQSVSGWQVTEPGISTETDAAGYVYTVVQTRWKDGSCTWGSVSKSAAFEAAKLAWNKAHSVEQKADAAYEKVRSRGEQLVVNGNGFMGDNTNFSWWTFDGSMANGSPGSFTHSPLAASPVATDEMFPVDTSKSYRVEFDTYSKGSGAAPQLYAMLLFYDVDKKLINIQQVSYIVGSTTTLAQDLKDGDTTVYLTNAAGFVDTAQAHQRSLIFWDYTNSFGYTYPPETYSRDFVYSSAGLWADNSKVDKVNNTITLSSPWSRGTRAAGTPVSQNSSGSTYVYFWSRTGSSFPLDEWVHASGTYSGFQTGVANVAGKFYKGTAYCRVGWLWNYQNTASNPQKQIWITNVTVQEDVATQANLDAARSWYATCDTEAATAAKVATIAPATTSFVLSKGTTVNVSFTKTNSAAVASLTLNVNSSGAKGVRYIYNNTVANLPAAGYLLAGAMYQFVYDGTYWMCQSMNYNTDANNVDRTQYAAAIAASSAISAGRIAGFGTDGKLHLLDTTAIDLTKPLLYVTKAYSAADVTAATTRTTNYSFWGTAFAFTNTHAVAGAAAGKVCYIVGTLSGTQLVPNSTVLTCNVPTTEDGLVYVRVGMMSTAANGVLDGQHPLYAFIDGSFREVSASTITATHRLWYRTDSELTTLNAPSAWVAEATGNVWNQWTTKVPPLAASTDDGLQKYPFLWTCEQRKRIDGTCECDRPQLDEHVTVIDGSMLVKGSVTAEEIAANTITTDNIVTGGLRIGNFSEEDQASILNSELREDIDDIRGDLDTYIEDTTAVVADLPTAADLSALDGRLVEAENAVESLKAGQLRSESWFDFDTSGGTGLHIGKVGSAFSTVVDEDSLDFVYTEDGDQTILATASGKGFDAPHLSASEDLTVAEKYRFTMLDADTFALIYVG